MLIALGRHGSLDIATLARQVKTPPSKLRHHVQFMLKHGVIRANRRLRPIRYDLGVGARVLVMDQVATMAFDLPGDQHVSLRIPLRAAHDNRGKSVRGNALRTSN